MPVITGVMIYLKVLTARLPSGLVIVKVLIPISPGGVSAIIVCILLEKSFATEIILATLPPISILEL